VRPVERGGIFLRFLSLLFLLAFLALIYVVRRPLLRLTGQFWVLDEPAEHADVIVVLGGDNFVADRAAHAAELYRAGLAAQVVASGRMLRPYAGISEMTARDLESRGVPAASIVKFSHRAANTREEAEALAGLVANRGWKRVLVVTSNYHARRTRFIFGRIFGPGVTVRVSAAHDSEFDPSHWWESRLGVKLFLNEVLGYAVAWWELRGKPHAAGGAASFFLTPAHSRLRPLAVAAFLRPSPRVSIWKHPSFAGICSFTELRLCIIVPSLPSSPGCFAFPRPCSYGVSVGGTHVA
jgi:uncharacterized SAM-binding protein YcdF (DUF218 family)